MSKHYKLIKSGDSEYTYISMSTDYSRPDDYFSRLELELNELNYEGQVAFDLLLSNGVKSNRYYSAYFNGERFAVSTFSHMNVVKASIAALTSQFYKRNYDLVSTNKILSKPQKFLIKRGEMR
jgi:hypothetical protein